MKSLKCLFISLLAGCFFFAIPAFSQNLSRIYRFYDIRTEIILRGKIRGMWLTRRNIFLIGVKRGRHIYKVILGPQSFLKRLGLKLELNDKVVIKGCKYVTRSGRIYIIARILKNLTKKKIYYLRNKRIRPLRRLRKKIF